jgi:Ca2+-binding RTX toxin-like protein
MSRVARRARVVLLPLFALWWVGVAYGAGNAVPGTNAGRNASAISATNLKPAACSSITLNGIRTGSGTFNDTGQPHLVLGSSGVDRIRGLPGNDCILGGAGNDDLRGDQGTDVCIGGPGTDTFHATCETRIQ